MRPMAVVVIDVLSKVSSSESGEQVLGLSALSSDTPDG